MTIDPQTMALTLGSVSSLARAWTRKVEQGSAAVSREREHLIAETRRAENFSRKIAGSAARRNCVAVFGPSQAGKSYLVSTLGKGKVREGEQITRLRIALGGQEFDYLKCINPPGGKESTGLVTRFTTVLGSQKQHDLPVELRLLSEIDLVKIVGNSFFSDFDPNRRTLGLPEEAEIVRIIEAARSRCGVQVNHLDEITMFDLSEYFNDKFKHAVKSLENCGYWDSLVEFGWTLPLEDRIELYSVLWGRSPALTDLFSRLIRSLEALGHSPSARTELSALVVEDREYSIINVSTLNRLGTPQADADLVEVAPEDARGVSVRRLKLPRSALAALVAEIRAVMTSEPWPFLSHTDLLDFPGARSRLKDHEMPDDSEALKTRVNEMLLRGKIAYLFERYTDEYDISSMMLCMPPGPPEVRDLTDLVRSWVHKTQGADAAARNGLPCSLFMVLTKFDVDIKQKDSETENVLRSLVDVRLEASIQQLFKQEDWLKDWSGQPFRNTYFLRNPEFSKEMFERDEDALGTLERRLLPQAVERLKMIREGILDSPVCQSLISNPARAWDAVMELNDGGVGRLIDDVSAILTPQLKRDQLTAHIRHEASRIRDAFDRFYAVASLDKREEMAAQIKALRMALHTAALQKDEPPYRRFFSLLRMCRITHGQARSAFTRAWQLRHEASTSESEALAPPVSLHDPWADEPSSPAAVPFAAARVNDSFDLYAEAIISVWSQQMRRSIDDLATARALAMTTRDLGLLVDQLVVAAHRRGLKGRISQCARDQLNLATSRDEDVADRAADIAVMVLNDFIGNLGFDSQSEPAPPEGRTSQRRIFENPPIASSASEVEAQLEQSISITAQTYFRDWGVGLLDMSVSNVDFEGGREISADDNRALGDILRQLAPLTAVASGD